MAMDIPPKGTILRDRYELGVRWRQMGRALAKDVPLLGTAGSVVAGWPLIRDLYPSEKATQRSDALTGRKHPTIAYHAVNGIVYAYIGVGALLSLAVIFGWITLR